MKFILFLVSIFGQKVTPYFLNLSKFVSWHLMATYGPLSRPPISHRNLFFHAACFELISGCNVHLVTLAAGPAITLLDSLSLPLAVFWQDECRPPQHAIFLYK